MYKGELQSEVFESILLLNVLVEDEWDEWWKNIWIWEKKTHETVNDIISNSWNFVKKIYGRLYLLTMTMMMMTMINQKLRQNWKN